MPSPRGRAIGNSVFQSQPCWPLPTPCTLSGLSKRYCVRLLPLWLSALGLAPKHRRSNFTTHR
eukprot:115627-Lingulodinium_polyedra.AAC.1